MPAGLQADIYYINIVYKNEQIEMLDLSVNFFCLD